MPGGIALGFFVQIFLEGIGKVNARLVGEADEYKQYIGHLIGELSRGICGICWIFEGLLAVDSSHEPSHFAHFFHEQGGVGEFGIVANANGVNPLIHRVLGLLDSHDP
jgi:hypothetical protein